VVALDRLPWPWGEEILAVCSVARAFVSPARRRQALGWASALTGRRGRRWRLAGSLCAYRGRFLARSAFVGVREIETWRHLVSVRGEEHLAAAAKGAILLGFHLGPPSGHLALRATEHRLTWVGGASAADAWAQEIRDRYNGGAEDLIFAESDPPWQRARFLHQARTLLLEGRTIFMSADGIGKEAFSISLPGGPAVIREGWLALRQATGVTVLPVLSHLEGRAQIVTIHPPLPALVADRVLDREACRRAIADLLSDYVRRFPEQCFSLAFSR
jgi:hypothetical protein